MKNEYDVDDVRQALIAVNTFDRKFGAQNCIYELFDAGHQIAVCVYAWEKRHAVRFKIGDDESRNAALSDMQAWYAATTSNVTANA